MQLSSAPFPSIHVANKVSVCMETGLRSQSAATAHCSTREVLEKSSASYDSKRSTNAGVTALLSGFSRCSSSLLAPEQIT